MVLTLLRDDSLTRKVLEVILDSPSGRRSLSRLARTCRALCEPALDILWRELDSFTPIVGLFPSLMRKARKPSMGLVKAPGKDDWNTFNRYNERVRRITYDERTSAVIASMLSENQPHEHIFPLLNDLTWRVQTPAGLNHWEMFISPEVHNFHLEVAAQLPQLGSFLKNMSKHTRLSTFSLNSPTALPEAFTDHLRDQEWLERVVLIAPGALSPNIGQWLASLEHLTQLQLDLSARGMLAVEGFFDQLISRSGCSTPSSETADEDEPSFSKLRRSSLRLTGDLPSKRIFRELRKLQLTGEVSNIAVFLSNITSPLTHMDFVIEDPPDKVDWQDLCTLICERFGNSLLSLRVTATGSARFADLVRSTPRGEPASNRLSLQFLTSLPNLVRLEIDLPESVIFTSEDFACLAQATPRLELLKLCPLARFPANTSSPQVTLDDLSLLLRSCRNIHTISAVFDAKPIGNEILTMRQASSDSLLRLHVGHSWISDPLRVAISLSHIAPRLETLKWFQEKTRQGYVETNAKNWQSLWDFLPVFQNIRLVERSFAKVSPAIPRRKKVDKCVGITTLHVDRGIDAKPFTANSSVQAAPLLVDRLIEAKPTNFNVSVDATPALTCASVDATTTVRMNHQSVGTETLPEEPASVPAPRTEQTISRKPQTLVQSYFYHIFSLFYRIFVIYPFTIPSQIIYVATGSFRRWSQGSRILPRLPQVEGRQRTAQNGVAHDTTKTMNNGDIIPLSNQAVQVGQ